MANPKISARLGLRPVVYVAGPISAATAPGRARNVRRGRKAGLVVWRLGAVPVVPHMNTLGVMEAGVSRETLYAGDLALLRRCDAMLRLPGWRRSRGARLESRWAERWQIPILDSWEELWTWLKKLQA